MEDARGAMLFLNEDMEKEMRSEVLHVYVFML